MNNDIQIQGNDFEVMNSNRDKGHRFELKIVNELKEMGYEAVSSRAESKNLDAQAVDIVSNFPYYVQCKFTQRLPNIWKIFMRMPPTKPPALFFSQAYKDDLVIVRKKDFYELIKKINSYEVSGKEGD